MSEVRGLPLLSGPPPPAESGDSCRKCNKEFNVFLTRSRRCNHCGYLYCHNCSDFQAMMPRGGSLQEQTGYDAMHVCGYCIEFLTITAAGRGTLKSMPVMKLRKYVDAYNINVDRAVEKEDFIDAIVKARNSKGCLPRENENFYRKYSVPNKSTPHLRSRMFGRSGQNSSAPPPRPTSSRPNNFPRPDLAPDLPPHPRYTPPAGPPPPQQHQYHPPPPVPPRPQPQPQYNPHQQRPQPHTHTHLPSQSPRPAPGYQQPPVAPQASHPRQQGYPQHQRPSARSSDNLHHPNPSQTPPRPRTTSAAPAAAPPPPPPTLNELLEMSSEAVSALSIGALKSILFTNHVNAGMILEKGDLVTKVKVLIEDERRDRERQRAQEEAEEAQRIERQREMLEEHNRVQREREESIRTNQQQQSDASAAMEDERPSGAGSQDSHHPSPSSPPPPPPKTPPKVRGTAADLERTGLCVICQDEEANIAIVDCGHLAMCRGCSDLIMASTRECPLCRQRIVTEARLLRIFKV